MERKFEIDENGFYPEIHEIVKNYLANKARATRYTIVVEVDDDEDVCSDGTVSYTMPLSEEEISAFRQLIEKYGEKDFGNHLEEKPAVAGFLECDPHWRKLLEVNLNYAEHKYRYTRHYLTHEGEKSIPSSITIGERTYTKLLYLGVTKGPICFNYLREQDEEVYNSIDLAIRVDTFDEYSDTKRNHTPFLVTLDEADEDVKAILEQNPDLKRYFFEIEHQELFIDWSEIFGKDK